MRATSPPAPSDSSGEGSFRPPRKSVATLIAVLLTVAVVLGCQSLPGPLPSGLGRTLIDDEGTTIELPAELHKIVSLTPATTELLFALGAGDRVAGRTQYDDYPPAAADLPVVVTYNEGVLIEKVIDIQPDLVLAGGNNFTPPADVVRLRELGLPVLVTYARDLPGVLADIRLVGLAIGAELEADRIAAGIQARIDEVRTAVAGLARQRVFYEIGNEPEYYGPAPQSFVADMVNLAGGEPITTTDPAVFSISVERLVTLDPEVIVLGDAAYGVCPASVVSRAGWGVLTAVREGAIRPVDDVIVTRPGPRIGEGLAALALAIHPEAAIAPPTAGDTYCAEAVVR